ncbi:MAG: hypothetical protein A4E32_01935 [Methanomassiliicoccales archaeon PtaU1.Bin124]|nr:MAG: hypothetical protein A4E32_01935 [Methanomassiliicoccales archaeon PtaU1.Bin124]
MTESVRSKRATLAYGLATLAVTVIAIMHGLWFDHIEALVQIIIPFSFVSLGMLIKYGDRSFDDGVFDQKVSKTIAVPCGIWMGGLIFYDPGSATIFIGLLLALLLAAKYDNVAFKAGFLVAGAIGLLSFVNYPGNASIIGIIVVFLAAYADELVSDRADRSPSKGWLNSLMKERPVLKLAVLVLCITSLLPSYMYFFAFLGFDLGYSFVERYSVWRGSAAAA